MKFSKDFVFVHHLNFKFKGTQVRDPSGQCPVQYLENIGPATEHFDWLILVIGPDCLSRVIKLNNIPVQINT